MAGISALGPGTFRHGNVQQSTHGVHVAPKFGKVSKHSGSMGRFDIRCAISVRRGSAAPLSGTDLIGLFREEKQGWAQLK